MMLQALRLLHRPGGHHGYDSVSHYLDYFDAAFGRLCAEPAFPLAYADDPPFSRQAGTAAYRAAGSRGRYAPPRLGSRRCLCHRHCHCRCCC